MEGYKNYQYLKSKYLELSERGWTEQWLRRLRSIGLLKSAKQANNSFTFHEMTLRALLAYHPAKN